MRIWRFVRLKYYFPGGRGQGFEAERFPSNRSQEVVRVEAEMNKVPLLRRYFQQRIVLYYKLR